ARRHVDVLPERALGLCVVAARMIALAHVLAGPGPGGRGVGGGGRPATEPAAEALGRGVVGGAAHRDTALAVLDGLARLALEVVIVDEIRVDAREALLVAHARGEPLGLAL